MGVTLYVCLLRLEHISAKDKALGCYGSQSKTAPHRRYDTLADYWSSHRRYVKIVGTEYLTVPCVQCLYCLFWKLRRLLCILCCYSTLYGIWGESQFQSWSVCVCVSVCACFQWFLSDNRSLLLIEPIKGCYLSPYFNFYSYNPNWYNLADTLFEHNVCQISKNWQDAWLYRLP